jgi:hypothetical protein
MAREGRTQLNGFKKRLIIKIKDSNAFKPYGLQTMSSSKTGTPIAVMGPASGFYGITIFWSGRKTALQMFFGYPQTQDVVSRFWLDP